MKDLDLIEKLVAIALSIGSLLGLLCVVYMIVMIMNY